MIRREVWLKLIFKREGWSEAFMVFFETQRDIFSKGGQTLQFMFDIGLRGWGSLEVNFGETIC